jgi:hypothetical protein
VRQKNEKALRRRVYVEGAARVGAAARGGGSLRAGCAALILLAAISCASGRPSVDAPGFPAAAGVVAYHANPPSRSERYCAWYGAQGSDGVLYFGEAAFWSAKASFGGDPTADLRHLGPQRIGRFDLAGEKWLPPLDVGEPDSRSGVWDVLVGDDGQIYFTTFFEEGGSVDPATGRVRHLALGGALNELAPGPDRTVLATRYGTGTADGGNGDVIAFDRGDGHTVKRWSLAAPAGYHVAPKTPLWDGLRRELLVTADQLPAAADAAATARPRHEAIAIDANDRIRLLPALPELMFAAKGKDGTIYRAEFEPPALWLSVVPPPGGKPHRVLLDGAFPPELDFAQDIQVAADGRVVVTRWSGIVHVLYPDGRVRSAALPHLDAAGLYYTAVLHGDRLCATYCADVTVVCVDAP